ncbi:MAG TPA: M23 family metallopeptidase [Streptosporangiaceae bacterium]|nr:M23 family metallopeptidase [Streptosporangiaceae bacterium]
MTFAALGCAFASFTIPLGMSSASASPIPSSSIFFTDAPGTSAPPATLGNPASMLYSMLPFGADSQPTFTPVTSVTGPSESLTPTGSVPTGSVSFSASMTHCRIGGCWATWSNSYTGDVYTTGATSVTMTLPDTNAFYFYAEPQQFANMTFTATTANGTTSGPITVQGNSGARYFGFYTTGRSPLTSINVTTSDPTGFAIGEFGIAAPYQFILPLRYITNPAVLIQPDPTAVGANITVAAGAPYYAVTSGTVYRVVGPVCGDGGTVLRGDDGVTYTYCNSPVLLVPNGSHVAAGTALGLVGANGFGLGPSLGFRVRYPSGTPRCPQHLLVALYSNAVHGTTNPVPNPKLLSSNPLSCAA